MSDKGVFAVHRSIWHHPMFADEPFTEREAWQWLISEASWKPCRRRVGTATVDLARGQVSHSLRFMADKWQWSEARVRRYLYRLKIDAMLTTATDAGVTVITICNYNRYQRVSLPTDAAIDALTDAAPTQHRRKEEGTKDIKEDTEAKEASDACASPPVYLDATHELWNEGVAILGQLGVPEKSARSNIGRWLRDAKNDATAVLGAIQRARQIRTREPIPFVTGAIKSGPGPPRRGAGFLELALQLDQPDHEPDRNNLKTIAGTGS